MEGGGGGKEGVRKGRVEGGGGEEGGSGEGGREGGEERMRKR